MFGGNCMKRIVTPLSVLALMAACLAQENTVKVVTKDGKTTVTVDGKEIVVTPEMLQKPLVIDGKAGKVIKIERQGEGNIVVIVDGQEIKVPVVKKSFAQGQGPDDDKIRDLQKRIAELTKELHELVRKRGGGTLMPLREGEAFKFDTKVHKELLEKLHKDGAKMEFKWDDKAHMELFQKLREMPKWDEKQHKEMMKELRKELGEDSKFFYEVPQGGMAPKMEFRTWTTPQGKGKSQKSETIKRFFDEPFFRTPESKSRAQGASPRAGAARRELAEVARERTQAVAEARKEIAAIARERSQAVGESRKAVEALRASGRTAGDEPGALRKKIAALEEEIRRLREENAKLKKGSPPPQVEVRSKRIK
jgi:hypothetical protein